MWWRTTGDPAVLAQHTGEVLATAHAALIIELDRLLRQAAPDAEQRYGWHKVEAKIVGVFVQDPRHHPTLSP